MSKEGTGRIPQPDPHENSSIFHPDCKFTTMARISQSLGDVLKSSFLDLWVHKLPDQRHGRFQGVCLRAMPNTEMRIFGVRGLLVVRWI
jgi:hypothetical protein